MSGNSLLARLPALMRGVSVNMLLVVLTSWAAPISPRRGLLFVSIGGPKSYRYWWSLGSVPRSLMQFTFKEQSWSCRSW